jgi:hypothetical protein
MKYTKYILVNKYLETMEVWARCIADAFVEADKVGFEVFDWEVEEGEDFA